MTDLKIRKKVIYHYLCPSTSIIRRIWLEHFTSIWILCIKLGDLPNMLLDVD